MTRPLLASIADAHDELANKASATASEWRSLARRAVTAAAACEVDDAAIERIEIECWRRANAIENARTGPTP